MSQAAVACQANKALAWPVGDCPSYPYPFIFKQHSIQRAVRRSLSDALICCAPGACSSSALPGLPAPPPGAAAPSPCTPSSSLRSRFVLAASSCQRVRQMPELFNASASCRLSSSVCPCEPSVQPTLRPTRETA